MHIGLYCPVETGHLNTMLPIGEALQRKGHKVTFIGIEDAQEKIKVSGINFAPVSVKDFPKGTTEKMFAELGELEGLSALLCTVNFLKS